MRLLALILLAYPAFASQPTSLKDLPDPNPEAERAAFVVPEGFEISLYASEPMIQKPVQMNWDSAGRLWVVSSTTYPQIEPGKYAKDQVVVLEDTNRDGKADKSTVFADGLQIPTAVIPGDGGAYIANSTEVIFCKDTDGDLKSDERNILLSGFGTEDTHHLLHTMRFGPEGLLYFLQSIYIHSHVETPYGVRRLLGGGVWEFRPETKRLEVISKGLINPWGFEFDRWGQSFAADGAGSEGVNFIFPGSVFATSPGASRIVHGLSPGQPKHCGQEIVEEPHFPDDWQGSIIQCDFRGNRINRFTLTPSGSSYIAKQEPDVLASNHRAFRPIDVKIGPDGALYIADWYNPIIQHGEVDFRDARRDLVHGRIWRLSAKGRATSEWPVFAGKTPEELVAQLSSPRKYVRHFAKRELRDLGATKSVPAIDTAAEKILTARAGQSPKLSEDPIATIMAGGALDSVEPTPMPPPFSNYGNPIKTSAVDADGKPVTVVLTESKIPQPRDGAGTNHDLLELAWAREAVNRFSPKLWRAVWAAKDPKARSAALRILTHRWKELPDHMEILKAAVADKDAQVRLWALALADQIKTPAALGIALSVLDQPVDESLDFLLEQMCREQADAWLPAYNSGKLKLPNAKHMIYALRASGRSEALVPLLASFKSGKLNDEDATAVLSVAGSTADAAQAAQLAAYVNDPTMANRVVGLLDALNKAAQERKVIPEGAEGFVTGWLTSERLEIRHRATILAGAWKVEAARPTLEAIFNKTDDHPAVREGAMTGLTLLGGTKSRDVFNAAFATSPELAIRGLTSTGPQLAAQRAVEYLATVEEGSKAQPILAAFLQNKQLPNLLAKALEGKTISEVAAVEAIRAVSSRGIKGPLEDALRKAGSIKAVDQNLTPAAMAALVEKIKTLGSAPRGEQVYRRQALLCQSCHAIGDAGGVLGPNLVSIGGSAPVDYLIESLINPSAKIKEGYHMVMVTTKDGKVVSGGLVNDGAEELVIRDPANQILKVAKANVASKQISPASMMPPGLTASLREDEFVDLVRFLSELGREGAYKIKPNNYVRTWRSMGVMDQPTIDHVRHVGLHALSDKKHPYPWQTTFATVDGALPLSELPAAQKMYPWFPKIAQFRLKLDSPGKVKLGFSATKGVILVVDDKQLPELAAQQDLDLSAGEHSLTILVNKESGDLQNQGITVELLEGAAKVVN